MDRVVEIPGAAPRGELQVLTGRTLYALADLLTEARRTENQSVIEATEFAIEAIASVAVTAEVLAPAQVAVGGNVIPFPNR